MKTSYFAKIKWLADNGYQNIVAVSGWVPDFYKKLMVKSPYQNVRFRRCLELAPRKEWFFKWKNGEFDNTRYIELYKETVLDKLNFNDIIHYLGEDAVLICYEKPDDFCHRQLISEWINSYGLECSEVNYEDGKN